MVKKTEEQIIKSSQIAQQVEDSIDKALGDDQLKMKEEAIAATIQLLGKNKDVETLTELTKVEITNLACIFAANEKYKIDSLNEFTARFIQLRISLNRKGRSGIENILKSQFNDQENFFNKMKSRFAGDGY